jgi:AraC-like DNA-binding protein
MARQTRHSMPGDINSAQRSQQALQLRAQGLSLRAVAAACGYADKSGAYRAIGRELDRVVAEDVTHLRNMEVLRLDELLQTFVPKAKKGDYRAADIVLNTIQVRCKILGLNIADREVPGTVQVIVREIPHNFLGLSPEEMPEERTV